jgi:putative radical SAM enzyme (TIGR03279 family)
MGNEIAYIQKGSIAEELDLEVGDKLLKINGKPINDILDYKFLMADDYVVVEIEKKNSEVWELEIEKEFGEDLGVEFRDAIMDKAHSCSNKCIFCFIDQLPKGMRKSLYFKDDDSRLAFLQGNFVTLTNLNNDDINRIIEYKISPINISVHTTNPELREKMLNNRFAGNIFERLKKLACGGIKMNCQIVLCHGINDGEELIKTADDLYSLYPSIENVAAVPVGITKFRDNLFQLKTYDKESAAEEIKLIESFQKKCINDIGQPFLRLSDEFYVLSGFDVPDEDFYDGYDQLEDGVGIIRYFRNNISDTVTKLKEAYHHSFTIITGASAYEEMTNACSLLKSKSDIKINAVKILNRFFGETITVAGLICGKDIIEQLKSFQVGDYIIIPKNMLRSGEQIFLDDVKVSDIESQFNRKVIVCEYTGENLIDLINVYEEEE